MSQRGFTLIELVVACLVVMGVTAAVAAMAVPMRYAFERTLGAADLSTGSRATLERLMLDLREAGSGPAVGSKQFRLADVAAVAVPLLSIDDPRAASPGRAITVTRVARAAPQGLLLRPANAGTTTIQLDTSGRCSNDGPACGFEAGMAAIVFDDSRGVTVTVRAVRTGGFVEITPALSSGFAAGAVLAAVTTTTYGLRDEADGSLRLVRVSPGGAEQPVLQNVVGFEVLAHGQPVGPQLTGGDAPWPSYGPMVPGPLDDDLRDTWAAGENCTTSRDADGQPVARLAALGPVAEPVPLTTAMFTDGPWCADAFDASRFDADLLRVRSIEIRLRVEAASPLVRGPVGRLFRRAGAERNAARWVPDVEMRLTIGIRNAGQ